MKSNQVFSIQVIILIGAAYTISAFILLVEVGPWESIRQAVMNGLLVAAWLIAARKILGDETLPQDILFRKPAHELWLLLAALLGMMVIATGRYLGLIDPPPFAFLLISVGTIMLIHLLFRYPIETLGLQMPSKRAWLALITIILINIFYAGLYQLLPNGEGSVPPTADLATELTGPSSVLLLMGGLLLRAALPEELVLRVGIQPRLARYMSVGFAILVQAALFSIGHLPQQLFRYDRPLILAIAYLLPIENGLIAGYLWYRTRSLPLLLILHLFAFPRFGN